MSGSKKLNVMAFSIVVLIISTIISGVYIFYLQSIIAVRTTSNIAINTSQNAAYIDEYIDNNYQYVVDLFDNGTGNTIDEKVHNFILNNKNYYLAGYYDTDESYYYETSTSTKNGKFDYSYLTKNQTIGQKASIILEKYLLGNQSEDPVILYCFESGNQDYFVVQKFDAIKNLNSNPYKGYQTYYFLGAKDGIITSSSYESKSTLTMNTIFSFTNLETFNKSFKDNQVVTLDLNDGNKYYAYASPILSSYNDNDIILYELVETEWINSVTKTAVYTTLVYAGVFVTIIAVYLIVIHISHVNIKRKYGREGSMIKDNNHYSVLLNKDGRVISKNSKFSSLGIRTSGSFARAINIVELEGDNDKFSDLLNSRNEFSAKINDAEGNEKFIKFLIIRNNYGYQLLGSDTSTLEYKPVEVVPSSITTKINENFASPNSGEIIETLLKDDLYEGLFNKKALYLEINKILDTEAKNNKKTYLFYFGNSKEDEIIRTYGNQIEELINVNIISVVKKCIANANIYNVDDRHFAFFFELNDTFASLNRVIDAINNEMKKPTKIFGDEMQAEVDFGIYHFASFNINAKTSPKSILDRTDLAFKHAVGLPNKTFKIYDENLELAFQMDEIIANDIKNGLKNNEFVAYYQPNYSLKDDRVSGFECLLRWNNDKYRNDSPFRYIQVAEKSGLINDIGFFTLVESFKLIKDLNDPFLHVSVNVSPAQFLQPGFISRLVNLYSEYNVPYQSICIEITETFLIQSMDEVIEKLKYLRSFGIKIYLDDFGTGYSSLLYLAELPVDVIKIDKEFITPLKTSKSSRTIVSELITIANELNIDIVAEGVEDDYQVNFLEKKKCNNIQGWYFSKAVPKEEVRNALLIKRSDRKGK
jgi:EAL domain-containing protein (putative c-di-GMP-specific phosphodiesterase class I)/GGDEF domain-containing protein